MDRGDAAKWSDNVDHMIALCCNAVPPQPHAAAQWEAMRNRVLMRDNLIAMWESGEV